MEISGEICEIKNEEQISDSFKIRRFVLSFKNNPMYSDKEEYVEFECVNNNCSLLDNFKNNDKVKVHFFLKGNKYTLEDGTCKYFNKIRAYRIELESDDVNNKKNNNYNDNNVDNNIDNSTNEEGSDLPF